MGRCADSSIFADTTHMRYARIVSYWGVTGAVSRAAERVVSYARLKRAHLRIAARLIRIDEPHRVGGAEDMHACAWEA